MNTIEAALDYSWNEAAFAVRKNGRILFSETLMLTGHDASGLPEWMRRKTEEAGCGLADITEWTVGTGPGSFSGLRIASALVMGMSYGKPGVKTRGISTASALAGTVFAENRPEKVLALFDGRRSEILAYGLKLENDSYLPDGATGVFQTADDLKPFSDYRFCALAKDRSAIAPFTGEAAYAESIDAAEFFRISPGDFTASASKLIYLRAAVFVAPKTPRII